MSRLRAAALGAVLLLPLISSCSSGSDHAVDGFGAAGQRVFESYRNTADVTTSVDLPQDVSEFVMSMDCVGPEGFLNIAVSGATGLDGEVGIPCSEKSEPDGHISMRAAHGKTVSTSAMTVAVTAPKGAEWSAAVDTRSPE